MKVVQIEFYLNKTHHLTSHLAKQTVVVFNVFNVYSVVVQIEIYICVCVCVFCGY